MSDAALDQKRAAIFTELKPLEEQVGGERQAVYAEYQEQHRRARASSSTPPTTTR